MVISEETHKAGGKLGTGLPSSCPFLVTLPDSFSGTGPRGDTHRRNKTSQGPTSGLSLSQLCSLPKGFMPNLLQSHECVPVAWPLPPWLRPSQFFAPCLVGGSKISNLRTLHEYWLIQAWKTNYYSLFYPIPPALWEPRSSTQPCLVSSGTRD